MDGLDQLRINDFFAFQSSLLLRFSLTKLLGLLGIISSIGSLLDDSKSDQWFVDALNAIGVIPRGLSPESSSSNVNCLLGLDNAAAGADSKPPQLLDSPSRKAGKISG
ncbi:hypothetical protein MRB53_011563 [Persea americana]|uniref:Uncharacterized protein n=1 Tax=Persea americana TaxID=3435 RepID=A0ACC2LW20_PERAE|nr:hypothetical protein MRB53_011563 [Persea americana]